MSERVDMDKVLAEKYIKHLDSIVELYEDFRKFESQIVETGPIAIVTRGTNVIQNICGKDSVYCKQIQEVSDIEKYSYEHQAEFITGIVIAVRGELQDGYLSSLTSLIHGEVFKNYLDMAIHLFSEGYEDAAAVIAGSTLETQLRLLAKRNGIFIFKEEEKYKGKKIHKSFAKLNQELKNSSAYSLSFQEQLTSYYRIRNHAAHGNYTEYSNEEVKQFINWLEDFVTR